MNVVWHQVTFYYSAFFLSSQLVKDFAKVFANFSKQSLSASFGDKYNVIFAIPFRMG
jgi:hypothetical protein